MSLMSLKQGLNNNTVSNDLILLQNDPSPNINNHLQLTPNIHNHLLPDNASSTLLPDPSFFSNFQLPFDHSFEEEITIRDKEDSSTNEYEEEQDEPMVLSDFGNVTMEFGASTFFDQIEKIAPKESVSSNVDEDYSMEGGADQFSVYRITTDGHTPFDKESDSEILYGKDGLPSEVVVYLNKKPEEAMKPSESRINALRLLMPGKGLNGLASSVYPHLPSVDTYQIADMEYDDGPFGTSRSDESGMEYLDEEGEIGTAIRRSGHGGHGGGYDDHGGGYDDHGGGYDDHHGGGYIDHHDDHDHGYSPVKKPGKFGKGKPNFKCEYAKETLFISKTTYKFFRKCYYIFKVKCKKKDGLGKRIGYKKLCNEFSVTKCRKVFTTKFKTKCWLVYKKKCENIYKTKIDWVYKENCKTVYEKECSGYGYHKHCHDVPKEICSQVPVKKEKQVKSIKCRKVPDKKCKVSVYPHLFNFNRKDGYEDRISLTFQDVPFFVPKKECKDFPKTVCTNDPVNVKKVCLVIFPN